MPLCQGVLQKYLESDPDEDDAAEDAYAQPKRRPTRKPSSMPHTVKPAVTTPITVAGYQMLICSSARLSPTARASMLVATERTMRLRPRVGSGTFASSSPSL